MKKNKDIRRVITLVVMAAAVGISCGARPIEEPAVIEGALVSITIPDLHGLLDALGTTASQVSPILSGPMLKSMLGMRLGDPALAGIAAGKGLAVVALDPATVFGVLEVGAGQLGTYTNQLATLGMSSRYRDGLLVVAKSAAALVRGGTSAKQVRDRLLSRRSPTIRVGFQPAGYIAANQEQVQGLVRTMSGLMGKGVQAQADTQLQPQSAVQGMTRVLEGEILVLLSLLKQTESVELVITPARGALRIDEVIQPVRDSRMATLFSAVRKNAWDPKVRSGAAGAAAFMIDFCIENGEALADFLGAEIEQLIAELKFNGPQVKGLAGYIRKWLGVCGGTISESVLSGDQPGLIAKYVMAITGEKAALDLFRNTQSDLERMGVLAFYAKLGMPMSFAFEEHVRTYRGEKIHAFKTHISTEHMPGPQREQIEAMGLANIRYELAAFDGLMAYAMGSRAMDSLIDALKDPEPTAAPLVARRVFPGGGFCYADLDVARYIGFLASFMPRIPGNPMPFEQIAEALNCAEPVTSAGRVSGGRLQWGVNVPANLLARIGQAVMAIQMQRMQQMGAPDPTGTGPAGRGPSSN